MALSQGTPATWAKVDVWSAGRPIRASAARSETAAERRNAPSTSKSVQATVR
jgi:hypothetical protein